MYKIVNSVVGILVGYHKSTIVGSCTPPASLVAAQVP